MTKLQPNVNATEEVVMNKLQAVLAEKFTGFDVTVMDDEFGAMYAIAGVSDADGFANHLGAHLDAIDIVTGEACISQSRTMVDPQGAYRMLYADVDGEISVVAYYPGLGQLAVERDAEFCATLADPALPLRSFPVARDKTYRIPFHPTTVEELVDIPALERMIDELGSLESISTVGGLVFHKCDIADHL